MTGKLNNTGLRDNSYLLLIKSIAQLVVK